jgi:hypothetical protein
VEAAGAEPAHNCHRGPARLFGRIASLRCESRPYVTPYDRPYAGHMETSVLGVTGRVANGIWSLARRQRLEITYDPSDTAVIVHDGSNGHLHIRFRVRNRGWRIATDSAVLLTGVTQLEGDSVFDPVPERELKWANVDADHIAIQPRHDRLIDIAAVTMSVDRMLIAVYGGDDSGRADVPPGTYELALMVSATGATPRCYSAVLRFAANWTMNNDLRDHLDVVSVQSVKNRR